MKIRYDRLLAWTARIQMRLFPKRLIGLGLLVLAIPVRAGTPEPLDAFLRDGRIKAGLTAYADPSDNVGRFSLASLQTLDGLQQFSAGLNSLGVNPTFVQEGIPFFRMAMPGRQGAATNQATPAEVGRLFKNLLASLKSANATLTGMDEKEFKVEVNLSQIHLDLDGDGQCSPNETLLAVAGGGLGLNPAAQGSNDIVVRFDSADAMWLKGYTHFLSGVLELLLAYDWHPVWNQYAHVVFLHPEPAPPISRFIQPDSRFAGWADLIAAVHELRLNLVDKDGPRRARDEFRAMISSSRICWKRVLAETDNDKEWLPSPTQTGPGGTKITQEQINAWLRILDEMDAIATGHKLLPHWRMKPGLGINVDKMVASPPPLDLVLLLQGSVLIPYVEEGEVSDMATWRQLTQVFGPGFIRFAIWSN